MKKNGETSDKCVVERGNNMKMTIKFLTKFFMGNEDYGLNKTKCNPKRSLFQMHETFAQNRIDFIEF
jgi:hypothetical protein